MLGQMMQLPLSIGSLIDHAEKYHHSARIASVNTEGGMTYTSWPEVSRRARQLANALDHLKIQASQCCATLAWNNHRHLEIYFGVSSSERICHTINPRLFPSQIAYIINDADDQILFFDKTFLNLVQGVRPHTPKVKHYVLLGARDEALAEQWPELLFYEELLADQSTVYDWPQFDENTASSICYTSGTTGNPKGVLYSHRSTVLHSFGISLPDTMNLSSRDVIMPVVPMFHVNAWGTPYAAAMVGASMALPGPNLDGKSLVRLIEQEKVTIALGVPTIWQGLLQALETSGANIESLQRTVIGGAACPPSMIKTFSQYGVETIHAWGMTELSPLGTANTLLAKHTDLSPEEKALVRNSQGRPIYGIDIRLQGDNTEILPHDGHTQGDLQCRGHWVVERYLNEAESAAPDGWFTTGDVATIDPDGYMTIRDRSKDIIKSGGEWISTVELENIALNHPNLIGAAAIAAKHEKWDERPLLIVVKREGCEISVDEVLSLFENKIPKWQIPDAVVFVENLPLNATGKIMKNRLRELYSDYLLNQS